MKIRMLSLLLLLCMLFGVSCAETREGQSGAPESGAETTSGQPTGVQSQDAGLWAMRVHKDALLKELTVSLDGSGSPGHFTVENHADESVSVGYSEQSDGFLSALYMEQPFTGGENGMRQKRLLCKSASPDLYMVLGAENTIYVTEGRYMFPLPNDEYLCLPVGSVRAAAAGGTMFEKIDRSFPTGDYSGKDPVRTPPDTALIDGLSGLHCAAGKFTYDFDTAKDLYKRLFEICRSGEPYAESQPPVDSSSDGAGFESSFVFYTQINDETVFVVKFCLFEKGGEEYICFDDASGSLFCTRKVKNGAAKELKDYMDGPDFVTFKRFLVRFSENESAEGVDGMIASVGIDKITAAFALKPDAVTAEKIVNVTPKGLREETGASIFRVNVDPAVNLISFRYFLYDGKEIYTYGTNQIESALSFDYDGDGRKDVLFTDYPPHLSYRSSAISVFDTQKKEYFTISSVEPFHGSFVGLDKERLPSGEEIVYVYDCSANDVSNKLLNFRFRPVMSIVERGGSLEFRKDLLKLELSYYWKRAVAGDGEKTVAYVFADGAPEVVPEGDDKEELLEDLAKLRFVDAKCLESSFDPYKDAEYTISLRPGYSKQIDVIFTKDGKIRAAAYYSSRDSATLKAYELTPQEYTMDSFLRFEAARKPRE